MEGFGEVSEDHVKGLMWFSASFLQPLSYEDHFHHTPFWTQTTWRRRKDGSGQGEDAVCSEHSKSEEMRC